MKILANFEKFSLQIIFLMLSPIFEKNPFTAKTQKKTWPNRFFHYVVKMEHISKNVIITSTNRHLSNKKILHGRRGKTIAL